MPLTDRPRRARRQVSDATEESSEEVETASEEEYDPRKFDSLRRAGKIDSSPIPSPPGSRSRRAAAPNVSNGTTVQRGTSSSADDKRQSLKLTVKAPPSKLREVMRANEVDSLQDTLGGGQVLEGPRNRRHVATNTRSSGRGAQRPRYAEYAESDIEVEEDEDVEADAKVEAQGEDEDGQNDFDEIGAEAEGGTDEDENDEDEDEDEVENEDDQEEDEDEDVDMQDASASIQQAVLKPPRITLKPPAKSQPLQAAKARIVATSGNIGPLKSVEDQEMEDDPGDDEVENSSDLTDEQDATNLLDEDAEGEDEEIEDEDAIGEDEEMEEDDEDDDESDMTPGSGAATPDVTRLTKRQRGRPEDQTGLMALDMAPQQRKFFTDAEKAMKKDEHARKRKELTKRRVQEEKTAALNRLLKPQASKARGAAMKPETLAAAAAASSMDDYDATERAHPLYTRWISTREGVKLGVPEEWLGKRVGAVFDHSPSSNGMLVQEID